MLQTSGTWGGPQDGQTQWRCRGTELSCDSQPERSITFYYCFILYVCKVLTLCGQCRPKTCRITVKWWCARLMLYFQRLPHRLTHFAQKRTYNSVIVPTVALLLRPLRNFRRIPTSYLSHRHFFFFKCRTIFKTIDLTEHLSWSQPKARLDDRLRLKYVHAF